MRIVIAGILVLLSLACLGIFLFTAIDRRSLADELGKATELLQSGKNQEALTAACEILKEDSSNEAALRVVAAASEAEHNYQINALAWRRIAELNPLDHDARYKIAYAESESLNFEAVVRLLEKADALSDPEKLELVRAWMELGRISDADKLLSEIDRDRVSSDIILLLEAVHHEIEQKNDLAKEKLSRLLGVGTRDSVRFSAFMHLAAVVGKNGGTEYLKRGAELYRTAGTAILASVLIGSGGYKSAIEWIEKLKQEEHSIGIEVLYGEALLADHQIKKLAQLSENVPGGTRRAVELKYYLTALIEFEAKDYAAVLRTLSLASGFNGRKTYEYIRFISKIRTGAPATEILDAAGRLNLGAPTEANRQASEQIAVGLMEAAAGAWGKKRFGEAASLADCAVKFAPKSLKVRNFQLIAMERANYSRRAQLEAARQILALDGGNVPALQLQTVDAIENNDVELARKNLKALLQKDPNMIFALLASARLDEQAGKRKEATETFEKLLASHPDDRRVIELFFNFFGRAYGLEQGLNTARRLQKSTHANQRFVGFVAEGMILRKNKKYKEAAAALLEAIRLEPGHPVSYLELAGIDSDRGNFAAAGKVLSSALTANPQSNVLRRALAFVLASADKNVEADQLYRLVRQALPDDPDVLINHSEVLAALGKREEALQAALRARGIAPGNASVIECYGMREFESGNYPVAVSVLGNLHYKNPGNQRVSGILILAYQKDIAAKLASGELEQARKSVQNYRRDFPSDPEAKKLEAKVAEALKNVP
ncbi:MAG: tetratricopeptide repeat protein [Victivallaceae bacterium]|nr:tetratricopeptide repeat protein [Victivallaceae bacterium]